MFFVKYLTVAFSVDFLAKIHNPFPASQERFQQFRVIELFSTSSFSALRKFFRSNTLLLEFSKSFKK